MSVDGPPASGSMPQVPEAPSLVGTIFENKYRITRKLGEGGMGEVYAAEHIHIAKKVAIKLLRPEIVSNQEAVSRFSQEARSSSSIGHRNIITIDDFGQLPDGRVYMYMELLNGAALNDLIMQPQPPDRLLNIMIQTGHGLAAAHAKGIVHRDMKPENIFVTIGPNNEDVPKILDFGIAKVAGNDGQNNLTRTGTIFGTPFYMAPEQALGNPVDARTDIYAVGVIMYELFAGSLPFQGESFMGILTQHITTEPEPVAQRAAKAGRTLPPGLAEVIARCMHKNPAERFATMDELVAQLVEIYRSTAGAGMSTYMEAFPVSRAHQVPTPPPMTGPMAAATSATVAAVPPPGAMPSGGHGFVPHQPGAPSAPISGGYPGASASIAVPTKKSSTGLIIAILAVLAVGGGITAVVVMGGDKASAGGGSGSQIADNGGSGSDDVGSATDPGSGGSATNNGGGSGSATTHAGGSGTDVGSAGSAAGSGTDVGSAGSGATPEDPPVVVDAGVPAIKKINVLVRTNSAKFEVWEDGAKLFDGPNLLEVPAGETRTIVLKARGYKDQEVTVSSKKKTIDFKLKRVPTVHNPPPPPPPPPTCTGTAKDLTNPKCRKKFCAANPGNLNCQLED